MYNIIVIDDHQMLRDMISETLNSQDDLNVVATAGNAKDSLELCKKLNPDLVLMDVCTENNSNGIAYSKLLKKQFPNVKVIIMTGILDLNFINDAKEAGPFIVGTGSSQYENQINNVLVFPGLFRGALDARANTVNMEMMLAASKAIASCVSDEELSVNYILPFAYDKGAHKAVAKAVADAAVESGVSKNK